jgi:hypothetical protein
MKKYDLKGKSEKACKEYYWKRGYRVVRGGIFLAVCVVDHLYSSNRLSAAKKLYHMILATQIYDTSLLEIGIGRPNEKTIYKKEYNVFLYREICRAQEALKCISVGHIKSLSKLARKWPHSIPFSGVPDYFVYKSYWKKVGSNSWRKYSPPKNWNKEMDYFFVEAKRNKEKMRSNQKSTAALLMAKAKIPVFIYQLTSNGYLVRRFNPIFME